jgi:hypothetical protein
MKYTSKNTKTGNSEPAKNKIAIKGPLLICFLKYHKININNKNARG